MNYFITGTDTDVGKTIACAWLMLKLNAAYWKPIQSGLEEKDIDSIKNITNFDSSYFHPSTYELTQPLSPHESSRRDDIEIDINKFILPESDRSIIVEGAGGTMVPINGQAFVIDLIKKLNLPVILVARSMLGTINHTLLTIEALQRREIPITGIIINGPKSPHNREALEEFGKLPIIAEIDQLKHVTAESLQTIQSKIEL